MNFSRIINQSIPGLILLFFMITAHASAPVLSFNLNGSPIINLGPSGTTTVSYTVTNHSKKPHQLALSSTTSGIVNSGGLCVMTGKTPTNPNPTCTLTLTINASALPANHLVWAPVLCEANPNGSPNANQCFEPCHENLDITRTTTPSTTLSTSVPPPSILALSVNNTVLNPALTGNTRQITIQNTGANEATGLNISYPTWPAGTTASSTCGATLAAGATCTITITPGQNATSNCTIGTAPTPGTITVSATNVAASVTSNVAVLGYGCQYQGGFLYSVDDTTNNGVTGTCVSSPCTGSIGGKVASLIDIAAPAISSGPQATSIIWSSNGSGDISFDIIPFIAVPSSLFDNYASAESQFNLTYANSATFPFPPSSAFSTCDASSDGRCNSNNIFALYDIYKTGYGIGPSPHLISPGPTSHTQYAAGLCAATINTYSDWYLPAICETNAQANAVACPANGQGMADNLSFLIGDPGAITPSSSCTPPVGTDCLAGAYWSSSESELLPISIAWTQNFSNLGFTSEVPNQKLDLYGVRCSRALTP